ncbi:hypothetical protein BST61_g1164 [Cercospora zeina]
MHQSIVGTTGNGNAENPAASSPLAERRAPLHIVIIGGSIAGLMVGFLLKKNGHHVTILEQATTSVREGTAAGVGLGLHVRTFFEDELVIDGKPLGTEHNGFEVLDQDLNVKAFIPMPTRVTSWDCAYYQLRARFDGLKSSYVENARMKSFVWSPSRSEVGI